VIAFGFICLFRKPSGVAILYGTGENTITAPDWKTFLGNEENKKQLIELLCRVWITDNVAPKLLGKNVITVSDGHAFHITSYDGTSVCRTEIKSIDTGRN
jgi:hypothetical protein